MASYQWGESCSFALEEIDLGLRCYRLRLADAEQAMAQSLRRYGQLSPIVVCPVDGRVLLVDGFKRHAAAHQVRGMDKLWSRLLAGDGSTAKAAMVTLNSSRRPVQLLEEAWIVQALVRDDGLSQPAVAELLDRHKSWVCRRLALVEKLADAARQDLELGLLSATAARQLMRLPVGNQAEALQAARRESLTASELGGMVELLLASGTQEKRLFVLEKPREALRESDSPLPRSWDPRMSVAGNRIAAQLARLLDQLGRVESWLRYTGRGVLELRDRQPLRPGFERLTRDARHVAELTEDLIRELDVP